MVDERPECVREERVRPLELPARDWRVTGVLRAWPGEELAEVMAVRREQSQRLLRQHPLIEVGDLAVGQRSRLIVVVRADR